MKVESLEVLEKADVAPTQARAFVRAIEIEIAGAAETLATKQDMREVKADVLALKQDVAVLRQDMGVLKQDTNALRRDVYELGAALRAEIHASASGATRQMYLAVLGQMAVFLGLAYFFSTHLR